MNPIAIPDDFVELVREGRSLQQSMDLRREHSLGAVQPYILATGTAKKIESLSVVLGDSHIIKLPRGCLPLRAVDVLIKAHWALSSHFCLGWKNTFRFLSTHIYKLPLENERLSTFTAEYKKLMSIEVDKS
ncbi:uncharacterized protein LOC127750012 [Frankliniella occidentalis]|uniref:Uncharacterized protein LOC127750012 n=1 Tax=Frankliniella occidentalis TaxID=133901 RepID=A0A9C6UA41_FRAOC|nr:uncharacterized protein LOC127750012 [Frankliniella occidentalis]